MLRERRPEDVPRLTALVESLRDSDRYPPHRPPGVESFVSSDQELSAFVVDDGGAAVGHVSVHECSARPVMTAATQATGVAPEGVAAIARLFVDPGMRGVGLGRRLLEAAVADAHRLGRQPILDVWCELRAAIALYESARWRRVGEVTIEFGSPCTPLCSHSGRSIRSFVYVGPSVQ